MPGRSLAEPTRATHPADTVVSSGRRTSRNVMPLSSVKVVTGTSAISGAAAAAAGAGAACANDGAADAVASSAPQRMARRREWGIVKDSRSGPPGGRRYGTKPPPRRAAAC